MFTVYNVIKPRNAASFSEKYNIAVESRSNEGSEFLVELPIRHISEEVNLRNHSGNFVQENNIEKIQVEFSDIYE